MADEPNTSEQVQVAASRYAGYLAAETYQQQCEIYAEARKRYGEVTAAADHDAQTLAVECLKLRAILRIVRVDLANAASERGRCDANYGHTYVRESLEWGKDIDRIHELIDAAIPDAYTSSEEYDKARDMLWKREDI